MAERINIELHGGPHDGQRTQMPVRASGQQWSVDEIVAYVVPQRPTVQALYRIECIVPSPSKCAHCGASSAASGSATFVGYTSVERGT
jgi:hypothetical protein